MKEVLERFDEDLTKIRERSRVLDSEILAARRRFDEHEEWAEQEKVRMAEKSWVGKERRSSFKGRRNGWCVWFLKLR